MSSTPGTKPAPMPWILCGPGRAAGEHRRVGRLHGDRAEARLALGEHLGDAGDRAARADARDQHVDLAVGVGPDLLGGGAAGGPRGWPGSGTAGARRRPSIWDGDLLGLGDRAAHALGARGQHQLGAVGAQQRAPLDAHRLGHREDAAVALGRADERQRDAGVARRGLHDDATRRAPARPSASAASIIDRPMRSLTEPAGLNDSSLPRISAPEPSAILPSRTSGVRPMRSMMESATGTRRTLPSASGRTLRPARRPGPGRAGRPAGRAPKCEMTSAAASDPRAAALLERPCRG